MIEFASLLLGGVLLAGAAADSRTFAGVITDTMCGHEHAAMNITPLGKCVRECVKHDKSVKYALSDGKNIFVLSDQQTPEKFAGQRVKVRGVLYEKTKIIKVEGIEPLSEAAPAKQEPSGHSGHKH